MNLHPINLFLSTPDTGTQRFSKDSRVVNFFSLI